MSAAGAGEEAAVLVGVAALDRLRWPRARRCTIENTR
jgi:hypothetical protein